MTNVILYKRTYFFFSTNDDKDEWSKGRRKGCG